MSQRIAGNIGYPSYSQSTYAVVERELVDEDETFTPRLIIEDVPLSIDRQQIKDALEKSGRVYGAVDGKRWVNHTILSFDKWPPNVREEALGPRGIDLAVTFDEIDDEAKGEKRVTSRMPKALHSKIGQRAAELDLSFNDFLCTVLEWAVDNLDCSILHQHGEKRRFSQRDAMRALYRIFRGDKDACTSGWIDLYKKEFVAVGKHPDLYPPETYAPQLWKDGVNKRWLTGRVSDEVVELVRSLVQ